MSQRSVVYRVIKAYERMFPDSIAYGYSDENSLKTWQWWNICIDSWDIYQSQKFKNFAKVWHLYATKRKTRIVFAFCVPNEKKLLKLAESDNLILNVDDASN